MHLLPAAGWIAAIGLLAAAVSSGWHGAREKTRGPWVAAGLFACGACVLLAVDGAVKPLTAGVLAFLALAVSAGLAWKDGKDAPKAALGHAGAGFGYLGRDVRGLGGRAGGWLRRLWDRFLGSEDDEAPGVSVEAAVAARSVPVPSLRDDDALGPPPAPDVIASVPVPQSRAVNAAAIAEFRPENAAELIAFLRGHASGYLAEAHAWRALADGLLNEIGLDPAFAHGVAEGGDEVSEMAHVFSLVEQRLMVIYGQVIEAVENGLIMPHDGRWFSEGEAA